MKNLKSILAFVISLIVLLVFYIFFRAIPLLPCISVFIAVHFLYDGESAKIRKFLSFLVTVLGILLYGAYTFNIMDESAVFGGYFPVIMELATAIGFFIVWSFSIGSLKKNEYTQ